MQNVAVQKAGQMPVPPQQVAPSEGKAAKLEALLNRRAEKVRDITEDEITP